MQIWADFKNKAIKNWFFNIQKQQITYSFYFHSKVLQLACALVSKVPPKNSSK